MNLSGKIILDVHVLNLSRFQATINLNGLDTLDVEELYNWEDRSKFSKGSFDEKREVTFGQLLYLIYFNAKRDAINYITRRDED